MDAKPRDWSMDILRIIACMMVICVHVVAKGINVPKVQTGEWGILNFYDALGRPALALFYMISGSLMLRKDHIDIKDLWIRKIFRISMLLLFWIIFYYVMDTGLKYVIREPQNAFKNFFTTENKYHLWYLRVQFSLYVFTPVYAIAVRKLDRKTVNYFFTIFIIFNIIQHTFLSIPRIPNWLKWPVNNLIYVEISDAVGYFLLGYFLTDDRQFDTEKYSNGKLLGIYIVSLILAATVNHIFSLIINRPSVALHGNSSLPILFESVTLFILIKRKFSNYKFNKKIGKLIKNISKSTLFIYLIHPFFIDRMAKDFGFNILNYNPLISVPFAVILYFIVGVICGVILEKIPILNKLL